MHTYTATLLAEHVLRNTRFEACSTVHTKVTGTKPTCSIRAVNIDLHIVIEKSRPDSSCRFASPRNKRSITQIQASSSSGKEARDAETGKITNESIFKAISTLDTEEYMIHRATSGSDGL